MDVVKLVGKYLNTPTGPICYNTDKVLTTVLDKENIEGFATIILRLAARSGVSMTREQSALSYQWLEYVATYVNQAIANSTYAKTFLQGLNRGLRKNTFLTGSHLTIVDIAVYHAVYPLIERLTNLEQESLVHVCRWVKHLQVQPNVCGNRPALSINTLTLSILAPAVH